MNSNTNKTTQQTNQIQMATRKSSYLYLGGERINPLPLSSDFEFDETDIWNLNSEIVSIDSKKSIPTSRSIKRPVRRLDLIDRKPISGTSLPVNVPDWAKILRQEFKGRRREAEEDDEVDSDQNDDIGGGRDEEWVPPHEYLAKNRIASFSVHEGIGRTLKGRDLSRVRNAIWKKTGFED